MRILRFLARVLAVTVALLALPVVAGAVGVTGTLDSRYASAPPSPDVASAPPRHDPAKPTAVVVLGAAGAQVSDVLAPYEIFAATGRLNVYTVAAARRPVTLTGGLDLVPDLTFHEVDLRLGGAAADVVVVPAMPGTGKAATAPVTRWLREQRARGTLLLSVCNGSAVLASAGLLDGHRATAHWSWIDMLQFRYRKVDWVRGKRYIEDGAVVSSAGVLSGIDATLHVVERLVGVDAAVRAAAAIGWRHFRPGRPVPSAVTGFAPSDAVALLNAAYRWDPPTVGVVLTEGVGEIELASVFDTYGGQSLAARTLAVTVHGVPVRSRHGLRFIPRAGLEAAAPRLDRLLVPGGEAARDRGVPVPDGLTARYVHDRPGFAFDAALEDLAAATDVATARWTAKSLELPNEGTALKGARWPWQPTLLPVALALIGLGALTVAGRLLRRKHRRRHHGPDHRSGADSDSPSSRQLLPAGRKEP